jgi:hypothetical protein
MIGAARIATTSHGAAADQATKARCAVSRQG